MKNFHIFKFSFLLTFFFTLLLVATGYNTSHTYASDSNSKAKYSAINAITPTASPTATPSATPQPISWCTGFNGDCWAIFASSHGQTEGPSTFIEVDPVYQPPEGFAFANVHSNGSIQVGDHPPIMGQVTYHERAGCENCFNSFVLPKEVPQKELVWPDFEAYREAALDEALASGQLVTGDVVWGEPIDDDGEPTIINNGVWYISGTLTIESGNWLLAQNIFVYVSGEVNIDGCFYASELSIVSDGAINILGTLQNTYPFGSTSANPLFQENRVALWSNQSAININTTLLNPLPAFFSTNYNHIRGAILAPDGEIHIEADLRDNIASGTLIGDTVLVSSNSSTGSEARIQYNGNYFPYQPPASIDASITLQGRPTLPDERWVVPLRISLTISGESTPADEFTPTTDENGHFTLTDITAGSYEIRVKHAHTLQNMQTVTLTAGSNTIDFGTLREGDANDDNFVTILDFSILAATFGRCEGANGYNGRADFNGDTCVTILDFSLLASHFGQSGQGAPANASGQGSEGRVGARMNITSR